MSLGLNLLLQFNGPGIVILLLILPCKHIQNNQASILRMQILKQWLQTTMDLRHLDLQTQIIQE